MDPSASDAGQWWPESNEPTSTATAEPPRYREQVTKLAIDSVGVGDDEFSVIVFKSCGPKYEQQSDEDYRARKDKDQKSRDGVPVWSIEVSAQQPPRGKMVRPRSVDFKVSVPSVKDPAELFGYCESVRFDGLRYGVTEVTRKGGVKGFATYFTADAIESAAPARPQAT